MSNIRITSEVIKGILLRFNHYLPQVAPLETNHLDCIHSSAASREYVEGNFLLTMGHWVDCGGCDYFMTNQKSPEDQLPVRAISVNPGKDFGQVILSFRKTFDTKLGTPSVFYDNTAMASDVMLSEMYEFLINEKTPERALPFGDL